MTSLGILVFKVSVLHDLPNFWATGHPNVNGVVLHHAGRVQGQGSSPSPGDSIRNSMCLGMSCW